MLPQSVLSVSPKGGRGRGAAPPFNHVHVTQDSTKLALHEQLQGAKLPLPPPPLLFNPGGNTGPYREFFPIMSIIRSPFIRGSTVCTVDLDDDEARNKEFRKATPVCHVKFTLPSGYTLKVCGKCIIAFGE